VAHDRIELKLALVGFFRWLHGSTSATRHASLPWVLCDWERSTRQASARPVKKRVCIPAAGNLFPQLRPCSVFHGENLIMVLIPHWIG
jgi:hypothetical protein